MSGMNYCHIILMAAMEKAGSPANLAHQIPFLSSAAKMTLQELKQFFFRLKDEVFGTAKMFGYGCNTSKLAEALRTRFGEKMKMTDVVEPK
jgi:hypothetical protein